MPKSVFTEYRLELSSLLSLLFGFLTVISVVEVVGDYLEGKENPSELPGFFDPIRELAAPFGDWISWVVIGAPIGFIVCFWWFYDYIMKTRELSDLIDTPSKAKFVRNMDDIDYLAWSLPQRFEDRVIAKKREFKL
ncbi:MAG: hypothetical protein A3K67_07630 [Euryarchaeota archaeon RBG_16_62_10]|nr:MAG: hypothetical protein A3K67_07630 [Euryarchaeota archaeon RBG_16_62_10]